MNPFLKKSKPIEKTTVLKQHCKRAVDKLFELHQHHPSQHVTLLIGQPESGKSTLCSSHGRLLFSTEHPKFEIYLYQETLLLQLPNDFFLLNDERLSQRLWLYLGTRLRKYHSRLPITHCIACIDIDDFLTRSETSNETHLEQLALALDALTDALRSKLDVSLFFTKIDLLPGFTEFFENESKEFIEQGWGLSLEDIDEESFETEWNRLSKTLNERLIWTLHQENHPEKLHLIKSFPLFIESIKKKFIILFPNLLNKWNEHRYIMPTELYFVSCRQFKELTETSSSETSMINSQKSHINHISFFVKQALDNQCTDSANHDPSYLDKSMRVIFTLLCALLFIAFTVYNTQQFSGHIKLVQSANKVIELGRSFSQIPYSELKIKEVKDELEKIRKAWISLKKSQQGALFENHIFTPDTKLESQLKNSYQRIITLQWLPIVNQRLENYIETNLSAHPAKAYIAFKLYLMLSQQNWPIDISYIQSHLGNLLGKDYIPENILPKSIQKNFLVIDEDNAFIHKIQTHFRALPANKLAYILLFATLDTNKKLHLSSELKIEQPSLDLDNAASNIPDIYTSALFHEVYDQRLPSVAHQVTHGNKVLGAYTNNAISENDLLMELQSQYITLYTETWEKAIEHIHLTPTTSLTDLANQLHILTNVNSPMINLLKLSQTNTAIPLIEQSSTFLTKFNNILTKQSTPENNALYKIFALLIKLHNEILRIQNSNTSKAAACLAIGNENNSTPQNPSDAKQITLLATELPSPLQAWMQQIVDSYYALLNQEAGECQ